MSPLSTLNTRQNSRKALSLPLCVTATQSMNWTGSELHENTQVLAWPFQHCRGLEKKIPRPSNSWVKLKTGSHHAKFKAVAVTGVEKTPMLINNDHYTDLNKPNTHRHTYKQTKDQPVHKTCQAKHTFQRNCTQVIPKTAELHVPCKVQYMKYKNTPQLLVWRFWDLQWKITCCASTGKCEDC